MVCPFLVPPSRYGGKSQLVKDVMEVVGEIAAKQALDVLENKRSRAYLSYGANSFGKHVPGIFIPAVLTA
jgi:hypothetical protein